jgi:penicillin amidase
MRLFDAFETGPLDEYVQRKIGFEWSNPWRALRIREVLAQDDDVTLEDMRALQLDNLSIPARRILTALADLESDSPALDLLRRWDFHMDNDSPAAALFEQWTGLHGAAPNRFGRGLLAEAIDDPAVVQAIGEPAELAFVDMVENPEAWFEDGAATRDRVAVATLEAAVAELTEDQGPDMTRWRFGPYNRQALIHPLSALVDPRTRAEIDIEAAERRPTPNVVGNSGASWRFIAEPGNWDQAEAMSNPGQSGDPDSRFYENLFEPWRKGESFPLRFSRARVREAAVQTIRLIPAS